MRCVSSSLIARSFVLGATAGTSSISRASIYA
jgi:hypothetical protein